MANLPVKPQLIFGGSLAASPNIAQPGSTVGGTPAYSLDLAVLQALPAWLLGYASQLENAPGGLASPVLEELNGILYVITTQLAFIKQKGLCDWDPTVTYYSGFWARDPSTGAAFLSKTDNNTNNALTDGTNWKTLASTLLGGTDTQLKAWVTFDGRSGAIDESFNISGVARTSAGIYQITFGAAMADAFYGFSGSAGTRNGLGFINGDDNTITGGAVGKTVVRTATTCTVFCYDRPNQACEDSSMISVQFFGH